MSETLTENFFEPKEKTPEYWHLSNRRYAGVETKYAGPVNDQARVADSLNRAASQRRAAAWEAPGSEWRERAIESAKVHLAAARQTRETASATPAYTVTVTYTESKALSR